MYWFLDWQLRNPVRVIGLLTSPAFFEEKPPSKPYDGKPERYPKAYAQTNRSRIWALR